MLQITIPSIEMWDDGKQEFVYTKERTLQLEHSLVSLSKWESKWHKPFLSKTPMTREEVSDYIRCMTLTQNIPSEVYKYIPDSIISNVESYINESMTATWFSEEKNGKRSNEVVTAEIIYHWMIALNIPVEFQKWHLNRLLTQIRVCNIKNAPPKKMGKRATLTQNAAINNARRKQLRTNG